MYELLNVSGEVITKRYADSMNEAVNIFSILKGLSIDDLLLIYKVKQSV